MNRALQKLLLLNTDASPYLLTPLVTSPTPVASGADVIVNGGFAADANWTKGSGWTIGSGVASHAAGSAGNLTEAVLTVGVWYQVGWTVSVLTAPTAAIFLGNGYICPNRTVNGTYLDAGRAHGDTTFRINATSGLAASVDNVSAIPLTLSSLIGSVRVWPYTDYLTQVDVTSTSNTPAGVVCQLDSESSPANFVIGYYSGSAARLDKCVGGTYTNLVNVTVAHSAGAPIKVVKSGTTYQLFYGGAQQGTDQTISDAGIVDNRLIGVFNTDEDNIFANLILNSQ